MQIIGSIIFLFEELQPRAFSSILRALALELLNSNRQEFFFVPAARSEKHPQKDASTTQQCHQKSMSIEKVVLIVRASDGRVLVNILQYQHVANLPFSSVCIVLLSLDMSK